MAFKLTGGLSNDQKFQQAYDSGQKWIAQGDVFGAPPPDPTQSFKSFQDVISSPQPVPGQPPQQMIPTQPQQGNRIDPTTGQPLSDQDITNTHNRLNELQQDDWKYPVPFAGSNPNDPRTNEMNILSQRLYGSGAMPMPKLPSFGDAFGNRGSGQPLNQPMGQRMRRSQAQQQAIIRAILSQMRG